MTHRIDGDPIFNGDFIGELLQSREDHVFKIVNDIPDEYFEANSDTEIIDYCLDSHPLVVKPLQLYEDRKEREDFRDRINFEVFGRPKFQDSIRYEITMPFSGDMHLWLKKSLLSWEAPLRGRVQPPIGDQLGKVIFKVIVPQDTDPHEVQRIIDEYLDKVRKCIDDQKHLIQSADKELKDKLSHEINLRCRGMARQREVDAVLDIPLKKKDGTPPVEPIKLKKKIVKPLRKKKQNQSGKEWVLENENYELILSVFRYMTRSWETTPKTFNQHVEEELRDILLAFLNVMFEGDAGAECFRGQGKTDILIKEIDGSAFIAECKVWAGPKSALETVDQLFRYTTWRDRKVALIFFNKTRSNFKALQKKLPDALKGHVKYGSDVGGQELGEWRFIFKDQGQPITCHIFFVNLYCDTSE